MAEAAFVWNHALALQKRYYSLAKTFGWENTFISLGRMKHHFAKRIERKRLNSQTEQEVLERLYFGFSQFFSKKASRIPKFKRAKDFSSLVFKQSGYKLYGDEFVINRISKRFKFSLSRKWDGSIKIIRLIRSHGEWFIVIITRAEPKPYGKTHTGASVGIDFGLKTFMTLSDGTKIEGPLFYKHLSNKIKRCQRLISKAEKGSNHLDGYWKKLSKFYYELNNKRRDWFYKTAHHLCKKYDFIFIEDLNIAGMKKRKGFGKILEEYGWSSFVKVLEYVSKKYGVVVHKISRWYASSRLCDCGYKNDALRLRDRKWTCPMCGFTHDRDLHAAKNIYRQGVADLGSDSKTGQAMAWLAWSVNT